MRIWRCIAPMLVVAAACAKPAPAPQQEAQQPAGPAPGSPEWKMQNAMSAAPPAIGEHATIMDWPATPTGQPTQLRAGTNGWTCFPDMTNTPSNDPMCLDGEFMKWAQAWMTHTTPHLSKVGLSYMLQGSADADNNDPFKMQPDSGKSWVITGPHVMIAPLNPSQLAGMSTDPNNGGPYVMFPGTPYAHVMMPVTIAPHTAM